MNLVNKRYGIWDYDEDCKKFISFLKKNFKNKHACEYYIYKDDGSYNPPSGKCVEFSQSNFYLCATDLITIYEMLK